MGAARGPQAAPRAPAPSAQPAGGGAAGQRRPSQRGESNHSCVLQRSPALGGSAIDPSAPPGSPAGRVAAPRAQRRPSNSPLPAPSSPMQQIFVAMVPSLRSPAKNAEERPRRRAKGTCRAAAAASVAHAGAPHCTFPAQHALATPRPYPCVLPSSDPPLQSTLQHDAIPMALRGRLGPLHSSLLRCTLSHLTTRSPEGPAAMQQRWQQHQPPAAPTGLKGLPHPMHAPAPA